MARCRAPGAGEGRAAAGRSRESPRSSRRAPRLSWRWKRTARSRAGSISSSGSVRRRRATMLAWPMSRQRPTAGEEIRFAIVRRIERREGEGVGRRVDGRQVLEGDDHPETLRASRQGGERPGLGQARVLAGGLVREVGGVIDDQRGVHLGRVGDQPLERKVAVARPGANRPGAVDDGAEAGGAEHLGERRGMPGGLTWADQHRGRGRGDLDEAEPGRLDLLQDRRGGPPVVGNAESESSASARFEASIRRYDGHSEIP